MSHVIRICALAWVTICPHAFAQNPPANAQNPPADWSEPYPGHRVIGNLYAVGTAGLGVSLITSDAGHILINTGLEDSTPLIRDNIESLGYQFEDIKILLTTQYPHNSFRLV